MSLADHLQALMPHLMMAPILLPMASAIIMLFLGNAQRPLKAFINVVSCTLGLLISIALVYWVQHVASYSVSVYLPANWPIPYGIVLVLDRLSAMMLLLTSILGLTSTLYATARWHKAGIYFHPLMQFQLMGLAGAFLTGDIFNLFVFFEIMLAASYGLMLHGSGRARVQSSLHYLVINLVASSLLLIGIAILYGITGTLNMADMAAHIALIAPPDQGLLHAGAAILGIAFLIKAAAWPLNFWLPSSYSRTSVAAAALFAVLTKLGAYSILRVWTLFFSTFAGASALFGGQAIVVIGLLTLALGSVGIVATQHLGRLVGYCAIVSSGTLLAAMGFGDPAVTSGALYYILGSTLAVSALFLLSELINRTREAEERPIHTVLSELEDMYAAPVDFVATRDINLDDDELPLVGRAIPAAVIFLGLSLLACGLTLAGLPPFSGFVGKVVMLSALLDPLAQSMQSAQAPLAWGLLSILLISGLFTIIALSRMGIRYFWTPDDRTTPKMRVIETLPIASLLVLIGILVWQADSVLRYTRATAIDLHNPSQYINAVLSSQIKPAPAYQELP